MNQTKYFNPFIFVFLFLLQFNGFSASIKKKSISTDQFKSIWVGSGIDLYLSQGSEHKVSIECDNQIMDKIIVVVQNEVLTIKASETIRWAKRETPKVTVTCTTLKQIDATGGSDVFSLEPITYDTLTITANTGSDIYLTLRSKFLKVIANGGSDINLTGSAETLIASAYSGSDINASNLPVNICHIIVKGGSEAVVNVIDELYADASEDSDIGYIGKPETLQLNEVGSSDIYRGDH